VEKFVREIDCEYRLDSSFCLQVLKPLVDIQNPFPEIYLGCVALSATRLIVVNWLLFIVMEGGTSSATWFWRTCLIGTKITQLSFL